MSLYHAIQAVILAVGMAASGYFLIRFQPQSRRLGLAALDIWLTTFAVFALYGWVAMRIAMGLTEEPTTLAHSFFALFFGALISAGQVVRAVNYRRFAKATAAQRIAEIQGNRRGRRVTDTFDEEARAMLGAIHDSIVRYNEAGLSVAARLEQGQKIATEALRHLVETAQIVGLNLADAQSAVDQVAADLADAQNRAAAAEGPPGHAADEAMRPRSK